MKKKLLLAILIIFLTIGYAAVNTNLFIEVYSSFSINENDLSVYFSGAYLDDEDYSNEVISEDKKSIVVSGESLVSNGSMVISYDITNASTSYDVIVSVSCSSTTSGITFTYEEENLLISAREIGISSVNVSGSVSEAPTITCELNYVLGERTEAENGSLQYDDEYVVYGTLTDNTGNSLANANVVIYSETPHYIATDEDGYLFYNGIEKGSHEIYYVDDTLENIKNMNKDEVIANAVSKAQFTTRSSGNIVFENNMILKDVGLMAATPFCKSLLGTTWNYEYTGSEQEFLTYCDGIYKVELWGAQGGDFGSYLGGRGAYTVGDIQFASNLQLYLYVGGDGTGIDSGGYNGGGSLSANQSGYGAPGGGATDIRLINGEWSNFDSLKSRVMVAAGGGGANGRGSGYGEGNGGYGGALIGGDGESINATNDYGNGYGLGGTQTLGGDVYWIQGTHVLDRNTVMYPSAFGIGGGAGPDFSYTSQSAGGSGYYGGGTTWHGGGGGGSSFISGYSGCDAITKTSTEDNIVHTGSSTHYSGYVFTNSQMIAGNGSMPTHDGTLTMTGNTGNGYAKITLESLN